MNEVITLQKFAVKSKQQPVTTTALKINKQKHFRYDMRIASVTSDGLTCCVHRTVLAQIRDLEVRKICS